MSNNDYEGITYTIDGSNAYVSGRFDNDLTEIIIPNLVLLNDTSYNVTSIGDYAFDNTDISSVIIPDSVTSIGNYAFQTCTDLSTVTIGNSVESIGNRAFESCTSLSTVTIPDSVESIGNNVFLSCSKLRSLIWNEPSNGLSIGNNVFNGGALGNNSTVTYQNTASYNELPTRLQNYTYPDGTTVVFQSSSNIISQGITYTIDGSNAYVSGRDDNDLTEIIIPNSVLLNDTSYNVTSIGINAFYNTDISSVTIGDSVTSIGNYAFQSCTSLSTVTIGNSVESIGTYAFQSCTSLKSVTIGDSVISIGNYAFQSCTSLSSVTIPDSVTSIGNSVFQSCSNLISLIWNEPNNDLSIGINVFSNGALGNNSIVTYKNTASYNELPTTLQDYAYPNNTRVVFYAIIIQGIGYAIDGSNAYVSGRDNNDLTEIVIPNSVPINDTNYNVTSIGDYAFDNTDISSVIIPDSVTSIGNQAFKNCTDLSTVTIGNSVESIGNKAFQSCTSLSSVTIPDSVKSIGISVFGLCSKLQSITIPNSVESIGTYAFQRCNSLSSVTIPNSVTSIGNYMFYGCSSLLSITIPDSVESIGERAFESCTSLSSITIPDSVTSIGNKAFQSCTILSTVTIGNLVESIGDNAFQSCNSLSSVTIGNSVKSIGTYAFQSCTDLSSVTIPDSVESIGTHAFQSCNSLSSVTIGNSVTSIGNSVFQSCSKLRSLIWNEPSNGLSIGNNVFNGALGNNSTVTYQNTASYNELPTTLQNYTYPDGTTVVFQSSSNIVSQGITYTIDGSNAYVSGRDDNDLTEIIIPNSVLLNDTSYNVTSIGINAFYNTDISSVTIGDSVTSIDDGAFKFCSSLLSVTIPDLVESIGNSAFDGCTGLESVIIPDSVTSIGNSVFQSCSNLRSLIWNEPNNDLSIGVNVFDNGALGNNSIVTYKNTGSYNDLPTTLQDYTYPDDTRVVYAIIIEGIGYAIDGSNAYVSGRFDNDLTEIIIPNSVLLNDTSYNVTSIGGYAFYNTDISSVTISDSVTSIGTYAFQSCTSLSTVTIGDSVTSIGNYAFESCTSLSTVTIPDSVTSIGTYAFQSCTSLKSVTIGDSVTSIGNYAFESCTSLSSVTIGNSVESIGNYAFQSCISLSTVTIPDSVTSIGNYAFYYCSNVQSITIPDLVTSIGQRVFAGCLSLLSVTIPDSVTSIGMAAFSGCSSLLSITIPNSVESIGTWAFNECSNLSSVIIGNSIERIEFHAFQSCSNLRSLTWNDPSNVSIIRGDIFNYGALGNNSTVYYYNTTDNNVLPSVLKNYTYPTDTTVVYVAPGNIIYQGITYTIDGSNAYVSERFDINLKEIVIANSVSFSNTSYNVTSIGINAFYNTDISSVTISDSVTSIGNSVFQSCSNLRSLIWNEPNNDLSIGVNVFDNYALGNNSTVTYQNTASYNELPTTLQNYTYPDGTTVVFQSSSNIVSQGITYTIDGSNAYVSGRDDNDLTEIVIADSVSLSDTSYNVTSIGINAFYNTDISSVTIPNSVTSIGNYAFQSCTSLSTVTIGNSVESIGTYAFQSCTSLKSVTISDSVTSIGNYAFQSCTSLSSVTIPDSVTSIGNSVFQSCSNLRSLIWNEPNNDLSIGVNVFDNGALGNNSIVTYKNTASYNELPTTLQDYTYPDDTRVVYINPGHIDYEGITYTIVGSSVYVSRRYNNNLTEIVIPDSVSQNSINYPVTSIGFNAFYYTNITSVIIGNSVKSINSNAFRGCNSLTSVMIGSSVQYIASNAFYNSSSLKKLDWVDPANMISIAGNSFVGTLGPNSRIIYYSTASFNDLPQALKDYQSNSYPEGSEINYNPYAISNICFPAGTPISCNQGNIPIEKINLDIHTIRNKKIVGITKTISQDNYLVCFEKHALGKNVPSKKTIISPNHCIFYNGNMSRAKLFIQKFNKVHKIKYTGEVLYNVLMEEYDKMMVNNIICETLHPENSIAQLYIYLQNREPEEIKQIIKSYNKDVFYNKVYSQK